MILHPQRAVGPRPPHRGPAADEGRPAARRCPRGRPGRQRRGRANDRPRQAGGEAGQGRVRASAPWEPAHDPLHGQGRRRQGVGCRGHRAPLRGRGAADRGAEHRSSPQPLGRAGPAAARRAGRDRRPALGPGDQRPGRDGAQLGRRAGLARRPADHPRRRPHQRRGADRPTRDGRAVQPAGDQAPLRVRRLRRGDRRLRADRRDAAAVVVSRRRAGGWTRSSPSRAGSSTPLALRARRARRLATGRRGLRRRPAPRAQPDRDERDPARQRARLGAAGTTP